MPLESLDAVSEVPDHRSTRRDGVLESIALARDLAAEVVNLASKAGHLRGQTNLPLGEVVEPLGDL